MISNLEGLYTVMLAKGFFLSPQVMMLEHIRGTLASFDAVKMRQSSIQVFFILPVIAVNHRNQRLLFWVNLLSSCSVFFEPSFNSGCRPALKTSLTCEGNPAILISR